MAAPVETGFVNDGFGGANTHGTTWTPVAGTTLAVVHVCYEQANSTANSITSITDAHNTWVKKIEKHFVATADGNTTAAYTAIEVWSAPVTPGVATTTTFNFGANVDHCTIQIVQSSGANGTQPFDQNASFNTQYNNGTPAAQPTLTVSTTTANTLMFAICGSSDNQSQNAGCTFGGAAETSDSLTSFSTGGTNFCFIDTAWKSFTSQQTNIALLFGASRTNQLMIAYALTADASTPTGTWASTEAADIFAASGISGTPGVRGDLAATEAKDTFAAVGKVPAVGSMAATESPDIFSAFGRQPLTGTWASTEAKDQFHATGTGRGVNGTFISSEAVDIFAAVGHTPIASVWASTETPDKFAAFGAGVTKTKQRRVFFVT